jgi:hypothetical protein
MPVPINNPRFSAGTPHFALKAGVFNPPVGILIQNISAFSDDQQMVETF